MTALATYAGETTAEFARAAGGLLRLHGAVPGYRTFRQGGILDQQPVTVEVTDRSSGQTQTQNGLYIAAVNAITFVSLVSSSTGSAITFKGDTITVESVVPTSTVVNTAAGVPAAPVTTIAASGASQVLSFAGNGHAAYDVTLTAACAFTFTGGVAGQMQQIQLVLRQDSNANHTPTFPAGVKWPGGTAPTPNHTAGIIDLFTFTTSDGGVTILGKNT